MHKDASNIYSLYSALVNQSIRPPTFDPFKGTSVQTINNSHPCDNSHTSSLPLLSWSSRKATPPKKCAALADKYPVGKKIDAHKSVPWKSTAVNVTRGKSVGAH